jgi:hypothetical protein
MDQPSYMSVSEEVTEDDETRYEAIPTLIIDDGSLETGKISFTLVA